MQTYQYQINIKSPAQRVWDTMLNRETYLKWAKAFSPNSEFRGEWQQNTLMDFIDLNKGGTRALLTEVKPAEKLVAKHIGMLDQHGHEDNGSEAAEQWIGTIETYDFDENNGETELTVTMETDPEFEKMFENSWPEALSSLKQLCESSTKQ